MAEIIKARVWQKVDTEANWNANPLILGPGEQAFVVSSAGVPINFKIGDGTKRFSDLPWWIQYDGGQYIQISGNVLPEPTVDVGYSLVGPGTYTYPGQADIVAPEGRLSQLLWDGTSWSLVDMGELPMQDISGLATKEEVIFHEDVEYEYGSRQLFDKNNYLEDTYIDASGSVLPISGGLTTPPIKIDSSKTSINISGLRDGVNKRAIFLDENESLIPGSIFTFTEPNISIPLQPSYKFIQVYFKNANVAGNEGLDTFMLSYDEYLPVEPYSRILKSVDGARIPYEDYSTKENVDEIIKKAVPGVVNNSIFNGSFANNREGWVATLGGIVSAENNELKLIKAVGLVSGGFDQKIDTPSEGDKIYVSINAKFIDTLPVSSFMYLRGGYSSENSENLVLTSTEGEYSFHSKIFTIDEEPSGDVRFAIVNNYSSDNIGVELTSYFKYATLVNLTKVFGAGNEPSAEAVDKAIEKEPNKWIEDFVVISTDIHGIPYGIENLISNGDMSVVGPDGLAVGFQKGSAVTSVSVIDGRQHFTATEISTAGSIYYDLPYGLTEGNLYYISAYVDNLSLLSGGNTVPNPTKGMKSFIFDRPEGFRRVQFRVRNINQDASFGSVVFIDLTKTFGAGNEPSLLEMDRLLSRFPERWFEGTVSLTSDINSYTENYFENFKNKYSLKITSIPYKTNNPADEREIYPVLFGVKMSNQRNVNNGYKSHPIPVGWLYYIPEAPYKILYASGTPDNPKEIFTWDESITPGGNLTPEFYSPMICKNGDIVFVFRTEKSSTLNRQNPILYKASDNYAAPVVIDFAGKPVKPCAWLQNCGADFIYDENIFMFAEYVRSWSGSPNVWKVSYPLENPDNWEIVMTDATVEHFHTVQLDTYSNDIYVTSGDAESESNIWRTDNLGSSFELVRSGSALESRLLNIAFTEKSAFWASDDGRHVINQVDRGPDGRLDFDTLRVIFDLRGLGRTVTYSTVLIDEPFGLLLLDNLDTAANDPNVIRFFDLNTRELHELTTLYQMEDGTVQEFGFRSEAVNFYQSPATNKIVIGFGFKPNNFEMIGNTRGDNIDRRANLAIEIY